MSRSFVSETRASIVLESALLMPIYMCSLLALIVLIHLTIVQYALFDTVTKVTHQIAGNWPLIESVGTHPNVQNLWSDAGLTFPTNLKKDTLRFMLMPYVQSHANPRWLQPKLIQISSVHWPTFDEHQHSYVQFKLSYRYDFKIPFFRTSLVFHKQASERVWNGSGQSVSSHTARLLRIISITPSVLEPGDVATIRIKGPIHQYVTVNVRYKSGDSVAKGLQPQMIPKEGILEWKWKIGTNTTPGIWYATILTDKYSDSRTFEVISKIKEKHR